MAGVRPQNDSHKSTLCSSQLNRSRLDRTSVSHASISTAVPSDAKPQPFRLRELFAPCSRHSQEKALNHAHNPKLESVRHQHQQRFTFVGRVARRKVRSRWNILTETWQRRNTPRRICGHGMRASRSGFHFIVSQASARPARLSIPLRVLLRDRRNGSPRNNRVRTTLLAWHPFGRATMPVCLSSFGYVFSRSGWRRQ